MNHPGATLRQSAKGLWTRFHGGVEATLDAIARVYERILRRILRVRLLFLGLVLLALVGSLTLVPRLGQELFPQVDAGQIILTMRDSTGLGWSRRRCRSLGSKT